MRAGFEDAWDVPPEWDAQTLTWNPRLTRDLTVSASERPPVQRTRRL